MNKTIRIIITSLDFGGTERHLLQVLPRLKKLGWAPVIHTLRSDCAMMSAFKGVGVDVISPKKIAFLPGKLRKFAEVIISLYRLRRVLAQDKDCIVHFFLSQAYVLGMLAAKISGHKGPKIMSRRSLNHYQKSVPFFGRLERKTHKLADLFLANSNAVKQNLLEEGIQESQIRLIQNGIDLDAFNNVKSKNIRKTLGIDSNTFIMTMTANLIAYKGHMDLLEALSLIKDKISKKWILLLVGRDGGVQNQLEQKGQDLKLDAHIRFLGLRADIPQILSKSNLGVLCSHEEGMPNAVMEYMASSLPVVATTVGGIVELVDDGRTGFLVPSKNPEKLSEALLKSIDDKDALNMGKKGREKIEKEFSITSCVSKYDVVYKEFLRK